VSWARPRSLRGRLALFYALALTLVLGAFAATVYAILEAEEAAEPPEVAALEPPDQTGSHLLYALAMALPVGLVVAVGGALLISRRGLAPLEEVAELAGRVGTETLHQRVPARAGAVDEVARLVRAVNGMLERLDRSVAGMRRFTADASHELRTPLATLLGELEITLRRPRSEAELRATVETTLESLGRMSRMVEALLTLARSDAGGLQLAPERLDLIALVRGVGDPYEAVLAGRQIRLRWEVAGAPVLALADPLWTARAVANLIDNACKFTPENGEVAVAVRCDGARALVEVPCSGPGVPEGERERIFERFFRGEAARAGAEGSGLGLPLAREIARSQGGDLRAQPAATGARFVLELPSASA